MRTGLVFFEVFRVQLYDYTVTDVKPTTDGGLSKRILLGTPGIHGECRRILGVPIEGMIL